jgi:hypothetical protein
MVTLLMSVRIGDINICKRLSVKLGEKWSVILAMPNIQHSGAFKNTCSSLRLRESRIACLRNEMDMSSFKRLHR